MGSTNGIQMHGLHAPLVRKQENDQKGNIHERQVHVLDVDEARDETHSEERQDNWCVEGLVRPRHGRVREEVRDGHDNRRVHLYLVWCGCGFGHQCKENVLCECVDCLCKR